ncbi:MAG: hypothetical protein CMO80_04525 [Verrucomicrobiales bacterium]|nr:hypothetical protein [Verrucomicrobiales bacterium]|tara:strand:+ start:2623 stop:2823 length:201 start_codon:yes stop_codon:yes gene_type:complete
MTIVGTMIGIAVAMVWHRFPPTQDMDHFKAFVVRSLVGFCAFTLWQFVAYSAWFRVRHISRADRNS